MAFTEAQRVQIRQSLGYPDVYRNDNTRLEGAMDVIGERPDTKALVEELLVNIEAADSQIATLLLAAGLKSVDKADVVFFGNESGNAGRKDAEANGRMWVKRLSVVMGVPVANDIYSGGSYSGDWWSRWDVQMGTAGGLVSLG